MAERTRNQLKTFFETGDFPTEEQFADFIDSVPNIQDDNISEWQSAEVLFSDFQPFGLSIVSIPIVTIPEDYVLVGFVAYVSVGFLGGPITAANMIFEDENSGIDLDNSAMPDVFTADKANGIKSSGDYIAGFMDLSGSFLDCTLQVIGIGVSIDSLTQGTLNIAYKLQKVF